MAYVSQGLKEERFEKLPSGKYVGELVETTYKNHVELGDYQSVEWKIVLPEKFKGRSLWENFYFNNPDTEAMIKAQARYDTFLLQVGGIEKGQEDDANLLLHKICILDVYKGEYPKGSAKYYNRVNTRTLGDVLPEETIIENSSKFHVPQTPQPLSSELNDEIPF